MSKRRKAPRGCWWKGGRLYSRDPRDGKCKSLRTDVPELAKKVLDGWHREALGGEPAPRRAPLLSERIDEYLSAKAHKRSLDQDRRRLQAALVAMGDRPIDRYSPGDVLKFLDGVSERWTPATRNRHRAAVHALFRRAHLEGLIPRNPVALDPQVPEDGARDRVITADEFQALKAEADDELRRMLVVLWNTGARVSEVLTMRDDGFVQRTKNGESRTIPLNASARRALKAGWTSSPEALSQRFRNAARRAGVADVRLHDFRHTTATRLRRKGIDLVVLKRLLGHRSWAMVARYQHVADDELMSAVAED